MDPGEADDGEPAAPSAAEELDEDDIQPSEDAPTPMDSSEVLDILTNLPTDLPELDDSI